MKHAGAHLLAVFPALGLQADVGGVAIGVGRVGGHRRAARQHVGRRRCAPQVPLAGAVLLKVDQAAACDPAHLRAVDQSPLNDSSQGDNTDM